MILVCPSCDTRYFTEDAHLGKEGRKVRCASCGHSWFAKPPDEGSIAAAESTGLTRQQVERLRQTAAANAMARTGPHSEIRQREANRRRRNRAMAGVIAWAMGFAIFAGVASAAVVLRNQVTDAWPRAASLYKMVGLDVNRYGLDFEGVDAKRSFEGTTPVLTVKGWAINSTDAVRPAPKIQISLRDEGGAEITTWTDDLKVASIAPGQRVDFSTRIVAPPVETYALMVSYAPGPLGQEDGVSHATVGGGSEGTDTVAAHEGEGDLGLRRGEDEEDAHGAHEAAVDDHAAPVADEAAHATDAEGDDHH